jgi:predicted RNA-binding protein
MRRQSGDLQRAGVIAAALMLVLCGAAGAQVMINELYYNAPGDDVHCFTELCGPPDTSLDGYQLVGFNGSSGSEYATIDLTGYVIPADGYFVVAQDDGVADYDLIDPLANWQNGPDCVFLKYQGEIIEAIAYGESDPGCGTYVGWPYPGESVSHCPDCSESAEYWTGELSPGAENICTQPTPEPTPVTPIPTATPGPSATPTPYRSPTPTPEAAEVMINELFYNSTGTDIHCFTELCAPPGLSLDGYSLVGINGYNGEVYATVDLSGQVVPDDGFFVVAQDDGVADYDMIDPLVDWQNGPDCVLVQFNGQTIDSFAYGDEDPGCGRYVGFAWAGASLGRCPDCDFYAEVRVGASTTAGSANDCTLPTATPEPGTPAPTATPGPATNTPTPGPPATASPTSPPAPTATPTIPCQNLTLRYIFPSDYIRPGDQWSLDLEVCNPDAPFSLPLVIMLDVGIGEYWFWPTWKHYPPDIDYGTPDIETGLNSVLIIAPFEWPDTGSSSATFWFISAFLDETLSSLASDVLTGTFNYGP